MHCGSRSAFGLLCMCVIALCSGVRAVQVSGRFAHATLRRRLALARLNRMQVVVGALLVRESEGRRLCSGSFRFSSRNAWQFFGLAGNAGSMDCQPGQRMAISDSGPLETLGSWTAGEGDAGPDDDRGMMRRDGPLSACCLSRTRSRSHGRSRGGVRRYTPGVRCSDICPLCF